MGTDRDLAAIATHLCRREPHAPSVSGWTVVEVSGGSNSRGYHVSRGEDAFLVKIPAVDERNRAGREAAVLQALEAAGVPRVPRLVLFEAEAYGAPVVVETWLEGEPLQAPPESDDEWELLLSHLCQIHGVTEAGMGEQRPDVDRARDDIDGPGDLLSRIRDLLDEAPPREELADVRDLVQSLSEASLPAWELPDKVLCRVDHFARNYLRTADGMGSVDWEYAGWGDPANDLSELASHPSYLSVPQERWAWLFGRYAELTGDGQTVQRIEVCLLLRMVGWAVRCGRAAAGVPVSSDRKRMSQPGFRDESRGRYGRYLGQALEMARGVS
jgi:aminoglycoside phosphotransferase (APT) family kinase protein